MSAELFWWGYLLVTLGFGIPYSLATFKLSQGTEKDGIGDYIMMIIASSLLWPGVLGWNLKNRQEIKALKRARIHKRNAKLIDTQLENHKLAIKERQARHARALNEFDLQFPQRGLEFPSGRAVKQEFGEIKPWSVSAQDQFMRRALEVIPTHYHIGPCRMEEGQKNYLETPNESKVTCKECLRWINSAWH